MFRSVASANKTEEFEMGTSKTARSRTKKATGGDRMLLRCHMAGVLVGTLSHYEQVGDSYYAVLKESRKIHRWNGAAACDELSAHGINPAKTGSRVCVVVRGRSIPLSDIVEAYTVTPQAWKNLWGQPEWRA